MHRFIFYLFVIIHSLASCTDSELPVIEASKSNALKEMRLGESDYYLSLPGNFKLEEVRGKEGQLGYNIIPTDTLITMNGFIEIEYGAPIGADTYRGEPGKVFARSNLLNRKVQWIIEQPYNGYLKAYTDESGDLNANVHARSRGGIDSMISFVATLHMK